MSIYGLADCNNFFVSCERVLASGPHRTTFARRTSRRKRWRRVIERHSIAVISGNLQFYTDQRLQFMEPRSGDLAVIKPANLPISIGRPSRRPCQNAGWRDRAPGRDWGKAAI